MAGGGVGAGGGTGNAGYQRSVGYRGVCTVRKYLV